MRKCFIVTNSIDYHADAVIGRLSESGAGGDRFFRLNTDRFHSDYDLDLDPSTARFEIRNKSNGKRITSDEAASVWWRRPEKLDFNHQPRPEKMRELIADQYVGALQGIVACLEARESRFISHPLNIQRAREKVRMQIAATKLGFTLPPQLVTNSREALLAAPWKADAVVKPLDSLLGIPGGPTGMAGHHATALSADHLAAIQSGAMPIEMHYFQQRVHADVELRITCFGKHCFAFRIVGEYLDHKEIDWRRFQEGDRLRFEPEPDFSEAERCFSYLREMKLAYGAFDFMREKGQLYFLECNPNGQWLFCDVKDRHGMLDAFVRFVLPE